MKMNNMEKITKANLNSLAKSRLLSDCQAIDNRFVAVPV
jgi:hypothetical protein